MRCPYCSAPAHEGVGECSRCGFSLERLDAVFGAAPRLHPGISDEAGLFNTQQQKQIRAGISHLKTRFPQITFNVVTTNLKPGDNLNAYAFWLFNKGGISRSIDKGGENHDILFMIDAANAAAAMIVGYGLEPFVGEHHLQSVVSAAAPDFSAGRFLAGTLIAIATLNDTLSRICSNLDPTYGISAAEIYRQEAGQGDTASDLPY